ncbi:MAG: hypothetical protein LUQ59_03225 [Methanothrix sp.]|nr:hypothetical protein [Methanothrix sp.]
MISSVYGDLEQDHPSSIFVVVENNASVSKPRANSVSKEPDEFGLDKENARSITAELISPDDRIRILSGPQVAGLLAGGENTTLQFMALVEGVPPGIYPQELRLNYSWLSDVTVSEEDGTIDFVFNYMDKSISLPLQVKVMMGPRIELSSQEGSVASGEEAVLDLTLTNMGDKPALNLKVQASPTSPFLMVENGNENVSISPGESIDLDVSIFTDENATAGYYALPCSIIYQDEKDGETRHEEVSALVYVGDRGYPSVLDFSGFLGLLGATELVRFVLFLLLLLLLLAGGFWLKRRLLRKRRWVR